MFVISHQTGFNASAQALQATYNLLASDLAQSVTLDNLTASQIHSLIPAELAHIVQLDNSTALTAGNISIETAISDAGLTGTRLLTLDAGASASYSGSGQKWLDLSGNGYDFFRGAGSGAEASDPTFNGSAGGLTSNEYWSFDGGDFFRYDAANETFMDSWHKDNAAFTFIAIVFPNSSGDARVLGTRGADAGPGVAWHVSGGQLFFTSYRTLGGLALNVFTDGTISSSAWHFIAISLDEAGTGFFYADGAYKQVSSSDTFSAAYGVPSADAAQFTLELGSTGNGANASPSGSRKAAVAVLSSALTKANLDAIYDNISDRFGL